MRVAVAALSLALVAGCGDVGRPATGGSSTSSVAAPTPAPATVTVDLGHDATATIRVGQVVVVRPAPDRTGEPKAAVVEAGTSVLRPAGGGAATGWRFVGVRPGTVHVLVTYAPRCVGGELCPMFRGMLGRVTVTVTR